MHNKGLFTGETMILFFIAAAVIFAHYTMGKAYADECHCNSPSPQVLKIENQLKSNFSGRQDLCREVEKVGREIAIPTKKPGQVFECAQIQNPELPALASLKTNRLI